MMDNPLIVDLDYSTLYEIRNILENPRTMQSFLEVLPPDCATEDILNTMDIEGRKYNMTPAKYLLQIVLGSKGYRVSHLIEWFQAINLERALMHLKKHEGIRIIQHPLEYVTINVGEELLLTCYATSYPLPEYQWFKFDDELLLQIEPVFSIKSASMEDSGQYTCLVTRYNSEKSKFDYLYSSSSYVEVILPDFHATPHLPGDPEPFPPKFVQPKENVLDVITEVQDETVPLSKSRSISLLPNSILNNENHNDLLKGELITVKKHPHVDRKVGQGMSICLICETVCSVPVSYQWFKNRTPLPGEKSNRLDLINLYPDPKTGEKKWEYQCKVYHEYYETLSQIAVVELDDINPTTPFAAQEKVAFMVANDTYDHLDNLLKPSADVCDIAKILSSMDFKILSFRNLTLTEMRNAFEFFCKTLKPGSYALFFFSGHGFELYGQTYLQPIDCSENALQQEAVCSEYILERLQKTKPAMNVLLIDACRNLPSVISKAAMRQNIPLPLPGKIFEAKMKNNTIYGYSTTFLCASHESDSEANSVFVKHLKKYLAFNKRVEEILMMVQSDCGKDPLIKGIQCPVNKSTLQQNRKLTDPILEQSSILEKTIATDEPSAILSWCDIKRNVTSKTVNFSQLKTTLILEFHHHKEVFCNGMDAFVYLYIEQGGNLFILKDMEINIIFKSDILSVLPNSGISLKNVNLQMESKTLLFKKEILDLQKINTQHLEGEVSLRFCSKNMLQNIPFIVDIPVSKLKLFVNHLQSSNIDVQNNYRVMKNSFK